MGRRNVALGLTELEPRQLMAAGQLGINLAGSLGYVDLMKEVRDWTSLDGSTLSRDSNGWPLADAQILVTDDRVNQSWNGPDPNAVQPDIGGTYNLSFTGRADVTRDWLNNLTVQNMTYNAATNTSTAQVVVDHNSYALLYLDFRNTYNPASPTGKGVTNVRLLQPGYDLNTTQVFSTDMLNALKPFSTIRYLNADEANNYPLTTDANGNVVMLNWSDRRLPSESSQTDNYAKPGQAWENMIALANASNTDMWINVPAQATDDYVAKLANLIKYGDTVNGVTYSGLNPGLKVYLEYSNEVWGGIFSNQQVNAALTNQEVAAGHSPLNNDGQTDGYTLAGRHYLERTMQITQIFRGTFGADPTYSTIRPVLGWQEGQSDFYKNNFPWFSSTFGAPSQFFYGMGNANYSSPTDYSSVDSVLSSLSASVNQQLATTTQFSTIATYYGLQNVAYEGGATTSGPANPTQGANALAASRDPRMEAIVKQAYLNYYAAGGGLAAAFDGPFDFFSNYNQYSLAEESQIKNPSASPKWRGILDLVAASPQPVTVGVPVSTSGPTSLSVSADTTGQAFNTQSTGSSNVWLVNVSKAGNYDLSLVTGNSNSASIKGQLEVSISDKSVLGTYGVGSSSTYSLGSLPLVAGLNVIKIRVVSGFNTTQTPTLTLTPGSPVTVADWGFESASVGTSGQVYDPTGTPWTYLGTSGVASNQSTLTSNNAIATQGVQVGFVQGYGSVSQTIANWPAGTYQVSFQMSQRQAASSSQVVLVLVDNKVVGTFKPAGATYQMATSTPFTVTAGSHTITFQGGNAQGDNTAFIDQVRVAQSTDGSTPQSTALVDGSFEMSKAAASGYVYDPTDSGWTFSGQAGISGNNTGFTAGNPAAPDGSAVAFIQGVGSASQSFNVSTAGLYSIGLMAAKRANYGGQQTFTIAVDGVTVGTFSPSAAAYKAFSTSATMLSAGKHTLVIQGMVSNQDATAFVDEVAITSAASQAYVDASFEQSAASTSPNGFVYDPTDSGWTFSGQAGISGNNTGFTAGNPAAPDGSAVAFVQSQGSFSQTFNMTGGLYSINFVAARRGNYGGQEIFSVIVDGSTVGTFTPGTSGYKSYSTSPFQIGSGSHTVTFQGMVGSFDATAFIDLFSMTGTTSGTTSAASQPNFTDTSFESSVAPSTGDGFTYDPSDSDWSFKGQSGISGNNTAFTSGNANAPDGRAVAFLQNQGSFSQSISLDAGQYVISFMGANRANHGGQQTFSIIIDGTTVGTFSPSGSSYNSYSTAPFTLTAGKHTVTFQGMVTNQDATSFLDQIGIAASTAPVGSATSAPAVPDGSFEASKAPGTSGFSYDPTDSAWSFVGESGVSGNNSGFTANCSSAPDGKAVAFIQRLGSFSQTINVDTAGKFSINFQAANRANVAGQQVINVLVDGTVVGTFTPSLGVYNLYATSAFTLSAGKHTISFQGMKGSGDNTAFIDAVSLIAS